MPVGRLCFKNNSTRLLMTIYLSCIVRHFPPKLCLWKINIQSGHSISCVYSPSSRHSGPEVAGSTNLK